MIIRRIENEEGLRFTVYGPMASAVGERVYDIRPNANITTHKDRTVQEFILKPLITDGEGSDIFTKVKGYLADTNYSYTVITQGKWIEGKSVEPTIREIINKYNTGDMLAGRKDFYDYLIKITEDKHTFYEKLAYKNIDIMVCNQYYICGYIEDTTELYTCNPSILDKMCKHTILVKKGACLKYNVYDSIVEPYRKYSIDQIISAADELGSVYNEVCKEVYNS